MMNIAEHLASLRKSREDARTRLVTVAQASVDEKRSMNDGEQQEFDALQTEIESLDADIERFSRLVAMDKGTAAPATPADPGNTPAHKPGGYAVAKPIEKLSHGIRFARIARVRALAHTGQLGTKNEDSIVQRLYPQDEQLVKAFQAKAAVPAASTSNAEWLGNLINEGGAAFADFVEYLRPRTLLGQISDRLRSLPFDTPVLVQGSIGAAKWVKEGDAKPLTKWGYTRTKLTPLKVAAIAAATKESLMRASIAADTLLRDELARAVGATLDVTFIDPDAGAVSDTSPASVLNGIPETSLSDGSTIAKIRQDVKALFTVFLNANQSINGAFWVMSEKLALEASLIVNEIGASAFPGITPNGGTFIGLPVFTTAYANMQNSSSNGDLIALIRGDEIFLGDEGGIQVSMSDQASLVMDSAPSSSSVTPTAAEVVSLWQTNSVAFLVERFMNWQRRRAESVAWGYARWSV